MTTKTFATLFAILALIRLPAPAPASEPEFVASWSFDEVKGGEAWDEATQSGDPILGYFWRRPGVRGKALKSDGFTTRVVRPAAKAPRLDGAFTICAWIAPQAYPYNWCAIVNQQRDHQQGFFFGIDERGHLGLHMSIDGRWQMCNSPRPIPFMTKWSHIAGTFQQSEGLCVYVDGQPVASVRTSGQPSYAREIDLQLCRNHRKTRMVPESLVRPDVNFPVSYSFDGLLDELKIYDRALSADEIAAAFESTKLAAAPELQWRKLPKLPQGNGKFGGIYCRLKFYPEWDNMWRVNEYPDIVVNFDGNPYQMVFWRGTNFNMNLVTENGKWVADQSAEGGGGRVIGCCEHMSDKQCRYAHVRMIENHDARVVVHWRYAVNDVLYRIANMQDGWGAWADEYYSIYPDGVAIRAYTVYGMGGGHSITEPAALNNPGERAEDNLEIDALITANMRGEMRHHSWAPWPSSGEVAAPFDNALDDANISIVNFRSRSKPFYIYEPGTTIIPYGGGLIEVRDYSKFPTWNHWPVSLAPSDGRYAWSADRVSSSAVTSPEPPVEVSADGTSHGRFILGLTEQAVETLAPLARSWLAPPTLQVRRGAVTFDKYSRDERAFLLHCNPGTKTDELIFAMEASETSPLVNPAFVIQGWGESQASVRMGDHPAQDGPHVRQGHRHRLEGSDLVLWINRTMMEPVEVTIRRGEISSP